jgi:hypothetical protein
LYIRFAPQKRNGHFAPTAGVHWKSNFRVDDAENGLGNLSEQRLRYKQGLGTGQIVYTVSVVPL